MRHDTSEKLWFRAAGRGAMRIGSLLVLAGVIVAVALGLGTQTAAAGSLDVFQPLVNVALVLIGVGALLLLVGLVLWYAGIDKAALPVLLVGGLLVAVGLGGALIGWLNNVSLTNTGNPPPGPSGYVAQWSGIWGGSSTIAGGAQAVHDANTEFPAAPFLPCSTAVSPAGTVPTLATSVFSEDNTSNSALLRVTITTGAAVTGATYQVPDCDAPDIRITLTNPPPAVGGGLQAVPFWGRISITRTSGTQQNGSYADIFHCSTDVGTYLGFGQDVDSGAATHTTNHRYVSYTSQIRCPGPEPLVGDWIQLGTTSTATPQNGEWVAFWFVMNNAGLFDYNYPPSGSTVQAKIELGTMPGNANGYVGNIVVFTYTWMRV